MQCNKNIPELRFPEFKEEWEEKKLSQIIYKAKAGGTPKSSIKEYYNGNIPFLSINDMTNEGKYITYTEKSITEKGLKNSSAWLVPEKSLLYSMYASVGFVSINNIPLTTSQAIFNIIFKEQVSLEFMYYYLTFYKRYIHKYIETGTQGNLNAKLIKNFKIKIPSKEEQEKIANFLTCIDQKIELMEKKHTLYQNIKKYYLENLFPKENETIPNLRFLEFNNDWIKTTLGNCVIFLDEKRIPLNQQIRSQMLSKYPYYGAAGIIDYVNNYIFDDELILLGEDGSIIPTLASGKCWVSNHAHVLKNKKNINLYFLYNILSKIHFEKYNTGTIQPKLNKKTAKNIKIKITSKKEQEKIVDFMLSIGTKIKKIQKQIKFLKTFKKGLLQKMFC